MSKANKTSLLLIPALIQAPSVFLELGFDSFYKEIIGVYLKNKEAAWKDSFFNPFNPHYRFTQGIIINN